jgi:hypothetical protein
VSHGARHRCGTPSERRTTDRGRKPTPDSENRGPHPAGGFYVIVGAIDFETPHLYHIAEDASGPHGLELIETVPTFDFAAKTQSETFAFDFCSLAVGPDGTVYYQTYSQLWKISPQPHLQNLLLFSSMRGSA